MSLKRKQRTEHTLPGRTHGSHVYRVSANTTPSTRPFASSSPMTMVAHHSPVFPKSPVVVPNRSSPQRSSPAYSPPRSPLPPLCPPPPVRVFATPQHRWLTCSLLATTSPPLPLSQTLRLNSSSATVLASPCRISVTLIPSTAIPVARITRLSHPFPMVITSINMLPIFCTTSLAALVATVTDATTLSSASLPTAHATSSQPPSTPLVECSTGRRRKDPA